MPKAQIWITICVLFGIEIEGPAGRKDSYVKLLEDLLQACSCFKEWLKVSVRKQDAYLAWAKMRRANLVGNNCTVQRFVLQWNPALRTPAYNGQFCLSWQKAHIFSLKLTRFIRSPVNTDNWRFSGSRVTNSHILSTRLYGHWLSAHCIFIVIIMR